MTKRETARGVRLALSAALWKTAVCHLLKEKHVCPSGMDCESSLYLA